MNFMKNFKWQLMVVALGASLVMTGKVYSQEIVNTDFATPAASVGANFNTPATAAVNNAATTSQAAFAPGAAAATQATNEMNELGAESFPLMAGPLLAIAIIIVGGVVAKKISASRRAVQQRKNWKPAPNSALASRKPQAQHS